MVFSESFDNLFTEECLWAHLVIFTNLVAETQIQSNVEVLGVITAPLFTVTRAWLDRNRRCPEP